MLFSSVSAVTDALREHRIDAWLIYDFRGLNPLAATLLDLPPGALATRRLAASFTSDGRVRVLLHEIEQDAIPAGVDAEKRVYLSKESFVEGMAWLVEGSERVAAEYCPDAANPYLSFVDGGTVDLLRSLTREVVSSGDLIQQFQAVWSDEQWASHREAEAVTTAAFPLVWSFVRNEVRANGFVEEKAVEDVILDHFSKHRLLPGHPPIVGTGVNSARPHYETGTGERTRIEEGDILLVDLWGHIDRHGTIYSDLTRMGFVGSTVPNPIASAFDVVVRARDTAIALVRDRFESATPVAGWEVDRAGRDVIVEAGYGKFFTHRIGHSIKTELHGSGAHMDDLETHETRLVLPRTGFSIEPGIYMPRLEDGGFGVRSEVNVFVDADSIVHTTGGPLQTEVERLLA